MSTSTVSISASSGGLDSNLVIFLLALVVLLFVRRDPRAR